MNCVICINPFAECDKKTEAPCGCIGHTSCAFRILSEYLLGYSRHPLDCPSCGNQIYRHTWLDQKDADSKTANNYIASLKQNSAFNKDLAAIKKKLRLSKKAIGGFKKYLAPKRIQFRNEIKSHIDLIKSYRKRYMSIVKIDPIYKLTKRLNSSYKLALSRFVDKYNLTDDSIKLLKCGSKYTYYWNNGPYGLSKRAFSVRLCLW